MATSRVEIRGPKLGDAVSLWNFTPSPGWTVEETHTLRLLLMQEGIGRWAAILATGLLSGKLIQQLYGATQRLLGQQSLAAFTGLRVDLDRVRADNEARLDAPRKSGLIIHDGPPLTREEKERLQAEAQERYGASEEQVEEAGRQVALLLQGMKCAVPQWRQSPLLSSDTAGLPTQELAPLLCTLHATLRRLRAQLSTAVARRYRATRTLTSDPGAGGRAEAPKDRPPRPTKRRAAAPPAPARAKALHDSDDDSDDADCSPSRRRGRRATAHCDLGSDAEASLLDQASIDSLMGMGFSKEQAGDALAAAGGCVETALELLLC